MFNTLEIILISSFIWGIVPLMISVVCQKLPSKYFDYNNWFFRPKKFEKNGLFYEKVFKIKKWKKYLPDGAAASKKGYRKKHMTDFSYNNLNMFLEQSCRAELAHVLSISPFLIFTLFLESSGVLIMFVYALIINIPCILAQRYNRPRIIKIRRVL